MKEEEEAAGVLRKENKTNMNGKEGTKKKTRKKEREEEEKMTGLLRKEGNNMNMERKEEKGKKASENEREEEEEEEEEERLEDMMKALEKMEEKKEKQKQETKEKGKKLRKSRREEEEEKKADNQKDEKNKEKAQETHTQDEQEKGTKTKDEEIKGKKGHTFCAQLSPQVESPEKKKRMKRDKMQTADTQGTRCKARRRCSSHTAVTSPQAWRQHPRARLTPTTTEGSVRVLEGTPARYEDEESVCTVLRHRGGTAEAARPPHTDDEDREGPGREWRREAANTAQDVPPREAGGTEAPGTDPPTTDRGHRRDNASRQDSLPAPTPLLHEAGTSQLRLARLWARHNLRARQGLAVRCRSVWQGLKRRTRGLMTEGEARHAVLLQFPHVSVERLPDHLPGRRREALYFCHMGPRRSSPHLPQLLPHTRRLSRLEERLVDAQRDAHRRAQVFCRAALRYTGRQEHQVGVAGLYRHYCALERRAGVTPLARQTFQHTLAAAFPAAHVTPHGSGRPRLAVGVQPAHIDFWGARPH